MAQSFSFNSIDFGPFGVTLTPPSNYDVQSAPHMNEAQIPGGGTAIYTGTWGETLIRVEGVANLLEATDADITDFVSMTQKIAESLDLFTFAALTLDCFTGQSWSAMLYESPVQCELINESAFSFQAVFIVEAA